MFSCERHIKKNSAIVPWLLNSELTHLTKTSLNEKLSALLSKKNGQIRIFIFTMAAHTTEMYDKHLGKPSRSANQPPSAWPVKFLKNIRTYNNSTERNNGHYFSGNNSWVNSLQREVTGNFSTMKCRSLDITETPALRWSGSTTNTTGIDCLIERSYNKTLAFAMVFLLACVETGQ